MKRIIIIFVLILVFIISINIHATLAFAEKEKNNQNVSSLKEQITVLKSRISLLETHNEVLKMQIKLDEAHNTLLEQITQKRDSEIDRLWNFIHNTVDYHDLTRIIEAEASKEPFEGKLDVASVVINRVENKFANTVHGVIYQPGQFTPIQDGRFFKVRVSKDSVSAADNIIRNGSITNALYFMNPVNSSEKGRSWMRTLTYVDKVGNHEFYR